MMLLAAPAEGRRWPSRRKMLSGLLFALALTAGGLMGWSWSNNLDLAARTEGLCRDLRVNTVEPKLSLPELLQLFEEVRQHGRMLDTWEQEGVPFGYGFGLYRGTEQLRTISACYREGLHEAFVAPSKSLLEERLRRTTGRRRLEAYNALKAYLLLGDQEHLAEHGVWLAFQLRNQALRHWAVVTDQPVDRDPKLQEAVHNHLARYVRSRQAGEWEGEDLDEPLIERTRQSLRLTEDNARYYDQFVTILEVEQADPSKPEGPSNLAFPPITLRSLFSDRPEVLRVFRSGRKERSRRWQKVSGAYTPAGYERVRRSLDDAKKLVEREAWVGVTDQTKMEAALERVWSGYRQTYVVSWQNFITDIELAPVKDTDDRKAVLKLLSTAPTPYQTLLRTVAINTQVGPDTAENPIRKAFAPFIALGAGEGDEQPLRQYAMIAKERLDRIEHGPPGGKKAAAKRCRELLAELDSEGRKLWASLLLEPLGVKVAAGEP